MTVKEELPAARVPVDGIHKPQAPMDTKASQCSVSLVPDKSDWTSV